MLLFSLMMTFVLLMDHGQCYVIYLWIMANVLLGGILWHVLEGVLHTITFDSVICFCNFSLLLEGHCITSLLILFQYI